MASSTASSTDNSDPRLLPRPGSTSTTPLSKLETVTISPPLDSPTTNTHGINAHKRGFSEISILANSEFGSTAGLLGSLDDLSTVSTLSNPNVSFPTISQPPPSASYLVRSETSSIPTLSWLVNFAFSAKAVCQEVTELLYKQGTCRFILDITLPYAGKKFALRKFHASAIQNLDIDLRKVHGIMIHGYHSSRFFKIFSGSCICRQNCHITFYHNNTSMNRRERPNSQRLRELLDDIGTLTGFKKLTIKKLTIKNRPSIRSNVPKVSKILQIIKDYLEVWLGEAIWREGTRANHEAGYFEFHPRDHWEACQEEQSSRI
ncbi:MAG: hypothetical protein ASARMPRED_001886 [Alectoria sarmentosa]|nr:MAG: hypothetical protein ASARMPRED_001886 [Alectoria sarmentosa]